MRRYFIVIATLAMFMFLSTEAVQAQFVERSPRVTVQGYSEIKVTPDEIFLSIVLDESDTKGKVSLEEQRKAMFQALKRLKIDVEQQLKVVDMSSDYFRRKSSLAATRYELEVGSATEAREVFEALDAVHISNVNIVRAQCSNLEEHRSQARKAAIQNAKMKATELAEAIGQSIGSCSSISDYTTSRSDGVIYVRGLSKATNEVVPEEEPNVEIKPITIQYNVSAEFELLLK